LLIDELNHRVKNILATVQSIVWQAVRTASEPKLIQEAVESRLFALSRSHDLLTRENWEVQDWRDIGHDALEPLGDRGRAERICNLLNTKGLNPWRSTAHLLSELSQSL
jgi:two-component sensor histidine kinase